MASAQTLGLAKPRGVFDDALDRPLRYLPVGNGFKIESKNGSGESFNRPLYGANSAFRVDAGDLPEFMFYLPNRGGNLRLGIVVGGKAKWLNQADSVEAVYHEGRMTYVVRDALLGKGELQVEAVPVHVWEGLALKITQQNGAGEMGIVAAMGCSDGLSGSRRGDLGTESAPLSRFFALKLEGCRGNGVETIANGLRLTGQPGALGARMGADGPSGVAEARCWDDAGKLLGSFAKPTQTPVGVMQGKLGKEPLFLVVQKEKEGIALPNVGDLADVYGKAVQSRREVAERLVVQTPDPFINAAASAMCLAADATWDEKGGTVMHGAVAWRNKLLGWRGPYAMDAMGWPERMQRHLAYWVGQQNTKDDFPTEAHADPKKNLATDDWTMLHSNGSMSDRHYDMNLAFVDYYIRHALWTGDIAFLKKTWPMLQRHLAWEERCFRRMFGGSGEQVPLYEAYCAIWASDNLEYNGGGAAHASALNYYHHKMAARIAKLIGEDGSACEREAERIKKGMERELWMKERGAFAEYKDLMPPQGLGTQPAVWTYYHAVDSEVPTALEAYQMSRDIETRLAKIPIKGPGVEAGLYEVPTTNWMPYIWSLNNVVLAENAATALAHWQTQRAEEAFKLFKGNVVESMFQGQCPGNLHMSSQFDAYRGESQRDFADPTGTMSRALVEGLFGVKPDALAGKVTLMPGFPAAWDHASIKHPLVGYTFKHAGAVDYYDVKPAFGKPVALELLLNARSSQVAGVRVNGKAAEWKVAAESVGNPRIAIDAPAADQWEVEVTWGNEPVAEVAAPRLVPPGSLITVATGLAEVTRVRDPQEIVPPTEVPIRGKSPVTLPLRAGVRGWHTVFLELKQGAMTWTAPVDVEVREGLEMTTARTQPADGARVVLRNNNMEPVEALVGGVAVRINGGGATGEVTLPAAGMLPGTNKVAAMKAAGGTVMGEVVNWNLKLPPNAVAETVDLSGVFNADVSKIFTTEYLSPRSPFCSLAIPRQGVGGWSAYKLLPEIDDVGLRAAASKGGGKILLPQGIPFATPGTTGVKNVAFTSFWDNHPKTVEVPLTGKARHLYLLMTGTTNAMRSHLKNGEAVVQYGDGTEQVLALENPGNWWPIDQDYLVDQYAFSRGTAPLPVRVDLKTGDVRTLEYATFAGRGTTVAGGSATVVDLVLEPGKELNGLVVRPSTYEVIIGLMGVTLVR